MGLEKAKNEDAVQKIDAAGNKAKYDDHVRRLLANKAILARTLKETVREVQDYPVEQIEEMLEGTPQIHCIPVDPGLTNTAAAITGLATEDSVPAEGTVRYDILTYIMVPGQEQPLKILINVEAQKEYHQKYNLVTRAVYYGARRISAQKGTEFTDSNYDDIKKVYSIWLCFDANVADRDTVTEYRIGKHDLHGRFTGRERYDLMSCVFVRIGGSLAQYTERNLQRMLMVLFSGEDSVAEIKSILQKEYDIATNDAFDREVNEMCNLSDWVEERGIAKGKQNTIFSLVSSGKLTKESGAEELGVTVESLVAEMKQKGYPLPA